MSAPNQPPLRRFSLGLQHVLAMYAGAVIVPLIVGGALKLTPQQLGYLVSIDLLTCGIATLLQVWTNRFFGIGLPVILGCTFTAVGPMIAIGGEYGISAVYGAIIVAGIFVVIFAGLFGKLIRFFPPVVTGTVVTIIGVTLIPVSLNDMGGGQGSPDFGAPSNLLLAFGVLALIIVMNRLFTGFWRAISILLGLIIGTIIAAFMGKVSFASVGEASWFHMVQPFYFGAPTFNASAIITMVLVAVVSLVESTGVFFALGKMVDRDIRSEDLARGYRAEGLAIVLGGLFNAFPYTTYSQNVGLLQMSNVKTRDVIITAGGILVVLGLIPKVAAMTTIIPAPVLGGASIAMFGMVVSSGIRMLGSQVDLNRHENLLIIACSVGMGLGVTVVPQLFDRLPQMVQILTDNGIVAGSITAIVLNLVFNVGRKQDAGAAVHESAAVKKAG
ncbi:nucleobase:cation symporter-2 family protein [Paenibacillus allorhizosphaerae]|uniref:Nucleobase transporter PlUacP n=1 Tax=Paenibacillus allorhizosphaerae TaxID=2849866 RepID=A0ABN7TLU1_9BACL|nr:nucleobase:cation symporter-2 family protein [Paenibacillus allorhizosphaerae]CAG7637980.1 Nucleobase transporter PlUacP [Paenibacillus allorhizosphaerae]